MTIGSPEAMQGHKPQLFYEQEFFATYQIYVRECYQTLNYIFIRPVNSTFSYTVKSPEVFNTDAQVPLLME